VALETGFIIVVPFLLRKVWAPLFLSPLIGKFSNTKKEIHKIFMNSSFFCEESATEKFDAKFFLLSLEMKTR
jgi:hypothetical protein